MHLSYCVIAIAAILTLPAVSKVEAQVVRIGGTGAMTALLRSLGTVYSEGADHKIIVISNLGTSGAIRAVMDGAIDAAIVSRPPTAEEEAAGLVTLDTMKTPFGFVSSRHNPPGLRERDIATLFSTERATWPDGFPLRLVLRLRNGNDSDLAEALFTGMREAQNRARARTDIPVAATDQDNADLAARMDGSLTGASLAQILMEKRPLHFVDIDGVTPTLENLETGAYPYAKKLYVVATKSRPAGVDAFNAFLHSPKGRAELRSGGVLPVSSQ